MADKVRDYNQYIQLKAKYGGLGNPETTRHEFITTIRRDTYASLAQHDALLLYNSVAMNEPAELMRMDMIKKMALAPYQAEKKEEI